MGFFATTDKTEEKSLKDGQARVDELSLDTLGIPHARSRHKRFLPTSTKASTNVSTLITGLSNFPRDRFPFFCGSPVALDPPGQVTNTIIAPADETKCQWLITPRP